MTTDKKKSGFEKFISTYFSNLGKFTLVNLIFAVPFALAMGICFTLCKLLLPQATMIIMPLVLVLASPFYSGVVVSCKNIYFDETTFGIFKGFKDAVKENFKAYFLHGIVAYLAFVGCYHGIVIYNLLAKASWIFYIMLFVSVLVAVFLLFFLYAVPVMSAFFDLKLHDVYKNSALVTFGEIKNNFFATVGILAFTAVLSLPVMLFMLLSYVWGTDVTAIVTLVYAVLALLLMFPSGASSIILACLYPDMKRVISGEARANIEAIRKEDAENNAKDDYSTATTEDIDTEAIMKSSGEYVFYNGKMVKKSVFLEELKESEGK